MNQSDASTALNSGASPRSAKRLGSMPSEIAPDHSRRMSPGFVDAVGGQANTAQCDERVAAPVGKPGIAGDDRLACAALDEIGISRAMQRRGKRRASFQLRRSNLRERGDGVSLCQSGSAPLREDQGCVTRVEAEVEDARRRKVLDVVESAIALRLIAEVPVPVWLVVIFAVGRDVNGGNAVVGLPDQTARRRRSGSNPNAPFSRCSEW